MPSGLGRKGESGQAERGALSCHPEREEFGCSGDGGDSSRSAWQGRYPAAAARHSAFINHFILRLWALPERRDNSSSA